jgi:hypothetical protein
VRITKKKINTEKCIGTYTDITVQEILEVRHSQFEILTDNHSINENCPYGLRSVTSNNLKVPRSKSEYFKRTFLCFGTDIWKSKRKIKNMVMKN